VKIDPLLYGRIISMKNSDLDFDGKQDLLLLTDTGKILNAGETGYSGWGSDSFLVADIGRLPIVPPVLFNNPFRSGLKSKGLIVLAEDGSVFGFSFLANGTIDTLFSPLDFPAAITTYPLGIIEPDSSVNIYWGTETGDVFSLNITSGGISLDSLPVTDETILFIHVNDQNQLFSISQSGRLFRNGAFVREISLPYSSPMGDEAVALTRQGEFLQLERDGEPLAEEKIFRFDSPMITNPFLKGQDEQFQYFVTGENRLHSFNYNFTQSSDFPVQVYDPDRDLNLPLSPLLNLFFDQSARQVIGLVVTDPSGIIDGFDLSGNRLVDFPLAAGDSLLVSPLLTDIDGDGDVEIAAVTRHGALYLWDLASPFDRYGWNQIYYDEMNSNRNNNPLPANPYPAEEKRYDQLLPEKLVYNWPNPNIENYTFIRYYLTDEAQVTIKIFDLAGDLVTEFSGSGYPQTDNEIRWDLQSVQSGVYLARIEARSNQKQEVRIIKIAVVK
jgi:hypothetical protein